MRDDQYNVKKFAERRRLKHQQARATGDLSILVQPDPHFHVEYNGKPDLTQGFETETLARRLMSRIAEKYEEKDPSAVIYYEEGLIQIARARIKDRTGEFQIMMQPVECWYGCKNITRVHSKN